MEWKKNINTNLGITIILVFAALFTIIDFYAISAEIEGYPFNELSGNTVNSNDDDTVVEDKEVVEKSIIKNENTDSNGLLSEEKALNIGMALFDKMGGYYLGNGPKEVDSNGRIVGYIKNDDGSFSVTDNSDGLAPYFKLDKEKLRMIATEDYIRDYYIVNDFVYFNGEYYKVNGDRGSDISYYDTELKIIQNSADTIIFDAVSSYFSDFSYHDGLVSAEDAPKEYKTNAFRIVMEDGEWKISEFHKVY